MSSFPAKRRGGPNSYSISLRSRSPTAPQPPKSPTSTHYPHSTSTPLINFSATRHVRSTRRYSTTYLHVTLHNIKDEPLMRTGSVLQDRRDVDEDFGRLAPYLLSSSDVAYCWHALTRFMDLYWGRDITSESAGGATALSLPRSMGSSVSALGGASPVTEVASSFLYLSSRGESTPTLKIVLVIARDVRRAAGGG